MPDAFIVEITLATFVRVCTAVGFNTMLCLRVLPSTMVAVDWLGAEPLSDSKLPSRLRKLFSTHCLVTRSVSRFGSANSTARAVVAPLRFAPA